MLAKEKYTHTHTTIRLPCQPFDSFSSFLLKKKITTVGEQTHISECVVKEIDTEHFLFLSVFEQRCRILIKNESTLKFIVKLNVPEDI